jgi:hydroxymethylpyrimidine/phosphomethylpyrimidine kinase
MTDTAPPVVLVFAGSDPTGGAGIAADIETLMALGCHAAPVITAVTAQDTTGLKQFAAVETGLVIAQARAVLEDMPVAAIKTGMLGNRANLAAVATIASDYADIPLIVDPVLATGAGDALTDDALEDAYCALLLPRTRLLTPNSIEAALLAGGADSVDAQAHALMSCGAEYVLVTGTHAATADVVHRLYGHQQLLDTTTQPRLPHDYHGSGCTLAAACAGGIAQGLAVSDAVRHALTFTWRSLERGHRLGMGQLLPRRQLHNGSAVRRRS